MGLVVPLFFAGCSEKGQLSEARDLNTVKIRFPNGFEIRAEMVTSAAEIVTGMKFRPSLAPDRGMLFVHGKPGNYHYWMFEVQVPLDMIWMDQDRRIVQLIHKAPPCPGPKEKCLAYGGDFKSIYILEVPSGTAARQGLKPGMQLEF
jgi:uncharacterized membrane protein (UPF0127 family)